MKVINLMGGPSTGKSTTMAGLFFAMKKLSINVEMALEYSKDIVYDNHLKMFGNQEKIFAEQNWRLARLLDSGNEYAITDCPLFTNILYFLPQNDTLCKLVMEKFHSYENYNYLLTRQHAFNPVGRTQTKEEEAVEIDVRLMALLKHYDLPYKVLPASDEAIRQILVEHGYPSNAVTLP
jgi:nicotinamide riboside kinase